MLVWFSLIICIAAIGFAGARLSRYGDVIAEKTGIGGTVVGRTRLLPGTALPERVADLTRRSRDGEAAGEREHGRFLQVGRAGDRHFDHVIGHRRAHGHRTARRRADVECLGDGAFHVSESALWVPSDRQVSCCHPCRSVDVGAGVADPPDGDHAEE